ncbi:MAG: hypothetical protein EZS28_023145 [Streblomastix strix]|uniref:RNase H type-1 domain-containing protein n=1 Tax=Streblomastix strix TaxID=222440 RepID=A0A5J4VFJ0_9EUKA|nr:MAG: hypothetical protein EZS28_023145 [Streblomastix strix]
MIVGSREFKEVRERVLRRRSRWGEGLRKNKHGQDNKNRMLREMEERREQNDISKIVKSNQFYGQRGVSVTTGSVDKGGVGLGNNQSNQLTGSPTVEQDVRNQETGRRIEKNNGLSTIEYAIESSTFHNERSEQGTGNMEEERLGMSNGHQISLQSCSGDWKIREVPSFYAQGNTLYTGGNALWDLNSTEDLCKDNINNSRQSKKQESSPDSELCRLHSVPDAGPTLAREGNRMDSVGIQEIWMGDQREQEQIEAGLAICIPGMDVQLNNNGNLAYQREKEGIEGTDSKIDSVNNGIKALKDKKRGKFGWQAPIFHSIIQTRRTTSIANKQVNEQSCENASMDERNDINQEMLDGIVLVEKPGGEQQTKEDRQEIELDNNIDGRVNCRLGSECDQEQLADQKNIWIMGSGDGEFKHEGDTSNIESNLKTDNTNACFSIAKAKAKYHLRKAIDLILQIEEENGWTLTIRHIAGKQNKEADALSRLSMAGDYAIRKEVLEEVLKDWQVGITVDLFAARNNAKHSRYYTLGKDKKAEGRDSMRVSQEEEFALIHPPIPIISRVIRKIIEEKARGIMIVPNWPGQIWWTDLKEITVREKELGESERVLEIGSKMRKRNLKVPPGRMLALEVNGDKMEQNYFEMLQKPPDYQEMQLDPQQIIGMEVGGDTPARYQPFENI